jgi:hypothetical protein
LTKQREQPGVKSLECCEVGHELELGPELSELFGGRANGVLPGSLKGAFKVTVGSCADHSVTYF